MHLVGFFLQMAHVLCLSLLVVKALLMTVQDDVIVLESARNVLLLAVESHLRHLVNLVHGLAFGEGVGKFHDRAFAHAVENEVGTRIAEDALAQLILPVVVVADAAQRSLNTAQCHRYIGIEFLQYLCIDDRRIVGAHVVTGVGAESIFAAHSAVCRVAIHHRVHSSRRYTEEEARTTELLEVTEVAMPVGLWNDGYTVAVCLQDSSEDSSPEGWVVYVGITRKEDDVQFIPSSEFALLLGGWQEVC